MGGRQEAAGQEHLTRETIAQAPEDFLPDVRLEPIEGEEDTALRLSQAPQPCRVVEGEHDQFVIALQEMEDRPGRDRHTTLDQRLMESRNTVVVGRALRADAGEDIEASRVLGQGARRPAAAGRYGFCTCGHVGLRQRRIWRVSRMLASRVVMVR